MIMSHHICNAEMTRKFEFPRTANYLITNQKTAEISFGMVASLHAI